MLSLLVLVILLLTNAPILDELFYLTFLIDVLGAIATLWILNSAI